MLNVARVVIPASLLLVLIACTADVTDVEVDTGTGALQESSAPLSTSGALQGSSTGSSVSGSLMLED